MNKYAQMADRLYDQEQQMKRLEEENKELKEVHESDKRSLRLIAEKGAELELKIKKLTQHLEPQAMTALFEQVEEEIKQEQKIAELEKKISILLSCKNCLENKGGYICQKEYEDKCLAQKIQYIKELQEENAELKEEIKKSSTNIGEVYVEQPYKGSPLEKKKQLEQAKELLKDITSSYGSTEVSEEQMYLKIKRAEQFLKECEVEKC